MTKIRGRKHRSVEEVAKQLEKKGCRITHKTPITTVKTFNERPNKSLIQENYKVFISENRRKSKNLTIKLGVDKANNIMFGEFRKVRPDLFRSNRVQQEVTIQPAYCVNVTQAKGLGNKSWGKIDFLVNHNGYSIKRQ
jgi:hypothetical protein